ncbi:MAG: hypothetical protein ACNS64_05150 [Candidatus Halalkalibacterium sp. M3_1C_030]
MLYPLSEKKIDDEYFQGGQCSDGQKCAIKVFNTELEGDNPGTKYQKENGTVKFVITAQKAVKRKSTYFYNINKPSVFIYRVTQERSGEPISSVDDPKLLESQGDSDTVPVSDTNSNTKFDFTFTLVNRSQDQAELEISWKAQ